MVKPPLRTKSIGFKVSEEEYALLETAAQASGRTLGEWCREVILRAGSGSDYHLNEPWECTRIESSWAVGASLLHFRKISAQTDDATAFSVMEVAGVTQIWVIPTESGMLEAPNVESDPHNLAAFNALLRSLPKPPSGPVEWNAVGKLYMTLLGHTGAVLIEPLPGEPGTCSADGECTVAFSDRTPHAKEPYTKWTLTFSVANGSNPARLTDAAREIGGK